MIGMSDKGAEFFESVLVPKDTEIRVLDTEDDRVYKTTALDFKKQAQFFHFKGMQADHKTQIFLPRVKWLKYSLNKLL